MFRKDNTRMRRLDNGLAVMSSDASSFAGKIFFQYGENNAWNGKLVSSLLMFCVPKGLDNVCDSTIT